MTENEAKDILRAIGLWRAQEGEVAECEAIDMAIKALEEIQQYRAIGTVQECKTNKVLADKGYKFFMDDIELLKEYRAIGTIEEFKALKEKSEPKKILRCEGGYKCPICNHWVGFRYGHCDGCGQALDWSE